jgi:hypothetical protein
MIAVGELTMSEIVRNGSFATYAFRASADQCPLCLRQQTFKACIAHQADEYALVSRIEKATEIYSQLVRYWSGSDRLDYVYSIVVPVVALKIPARRRNFPVKLRREFVLKSPNHGYVRMLDRDIITEKYEIPCKIPC